ncbi:MAG TPA: hypothetical protein VK835_08895 [Bacteroidia bacterium]|jgi:hypothetical protein|nr:hypothetical protein [Bacteroidia bacterium]
MKLLKLLLIVGFFVGFTEAANAQGTPRVKVNTINGIIQTDKSTSLDLRFADVDQKFYDELVKKASAQKDFELYKQGFNPEYAMAQLRLKADGPRTLFQVEKLIAALGFSKVTVDSKEIIVSELSKVYHLKEERMRLTDKVKSK